MQKVIDASALLAYLNKESGWEKMEEILTIAAEKEKDLLMSAVNWGEVYYIILRDVIDYHKAEDIEQIIQTMPIEIVPADQEMAKEVATFKATHKLAYADSFAAALAKKRKAELVTGDKEFKAVEGTIKINWITS